MSYEAYRDPAVQARPFTRGFAITPHDSNVLAEKPRAIVAAVAGDVNVILADDDTAVVFALAAGVPLDISPKVVKSTSTTATGIRGLV
jgi:hypothetical protein